MSGVNNIPVPDADSNDPNEHLGSHSNVREDLDNSDEKQVDDAEDIPKKEDQPTGFDQVPRTESDRTDIERP